VPNVDGVKSERVGEECSVGFRILAVEEDVRAENHGAKYNALWPRCLSGLQVEAFFLFLFFLDVG
jgi:hypothetical protein